MNYNGDSARNKSSSFSKTSRTDRPGSPSQSTGAVTTGTSRSHGIMRERAFTPQASTSLLPCPTLPLHRSLGISQTQQPGATSQMASNPAISTHSVGTEYDSPLYHTFKVHYTDAWCRRLPLPLSIQRLLEVPCECPQAVIQPQQMQQCHYQLKQEQGPGPNGLLDKMLYTIAGIRGLLPLAPHPTQDNPVTEVTHPEDAWMAAQIRAHEDWIEGKLDRCQTRQPSSAVHNSQQDQQSRSQPWGPRCYQQDINMPQCLPISLDKQDHESVQTCGFVEQSWEVDPDWEWMADTSSLQQPRLVMASGVTSQHTSPCSPGIDPLSSHTTHTAAEELETAHCMMSNVPVFTHILLEVIHSAPITQETQLLINTSLEMEAPTMSPTMPESLH